MHGSGDVLDIMEQRHDWARMTFTPELFKYVFTVLIPEVISHSQSQDEEQVRGHYDRTCNNPIPKASLIVSQVVMTFTNGLHARLNCDFLFLTSK